MNKWIVFFQGGGWCSSPTNCLDRAGSDLGSSKKWPATYTDTYEGSAVFDAPGFEDFHVVYAMYCDGGSWSGNTTQQVNGQTVFYKGRPLLDALIDTVLKMGLSSAEELLFSGCSAGGLTTYIHADYMRSRVPVSVKMVALADAMFSLDYNDIHGNPTFPSRMQWGYTAWNTSLSNNDDCISHYGVDKGWSCMFGANVAPFVKTPLFILNSHYDTWQEKAILGLNCSMPSCTGAQLDYFVKYGDIMRTTLDAVPKRHAAFLTNCPAHCQSGTGGDYTARSVQGTVLAEAVASWYKSAIDADPTTFVASRWVEPCDKVPCGTDKC